ncbi:SWIM zinc finger family protein [Kitasatospora sp. NA04385]|uniref:SWIM zinc finger family protein n=1 Tax=Kitasatospora sp. NA04385 TaxID=2742135 RepID=UPI0015901DC8|nr:SWIM zinc finger family protein [Kitasatospora sp. NA04385]QKW22821.1 SWIM zinc finger family protein [Kitasatospora sp. NA04385]
MTTAVHALRYLHPSALRPSRLDLATSGGATPQGAAEHPRFFAGVLRHPDAAAAALLAVADVAAARYHRPVGAASLDPVVTADGDRLRFESFSGCGGVHARLDVLPEGLDGAATGHGTTNVDVNAPLREALRLRTPGERLRLAVGAEELAVGVGAGELVERKVPLPQRWLKGFAETQVLTARFDRRAELPAAEAVRFLRALPTTGRGTVRWVLPAGPGLRATSRPGPGAICLPGPERLSALRPLLRHATALHVYAPPGTPAGPTASAWELAFPGGRLTLTLSPDSSRGFSGEGGLLDLLAADVPAADVDALAALLAWDPRIEPADLAEDSGLAPDRVRAALAHLATGGQIGYDLAEAAHFHRRLPYESGRVEDRNPRLRSARALLAADAVGPVTGDLRVVTVGDHVHHVRVGADGTALGCTCRWWARHRGDRGPCSHVLAVRMTGRADWADGTDRADWADGTDGAAQK